MPWVLKHMWKHENIDLAGRIEGHMDGEPLPPGNLKEDHIHGVDIIFNTIPSLILTMKF